MEEFKMLVRDLLKTFGKDEDVTFIIAFEVQETPHYKPTFYRETPIRKVWEWLESKTATNFEVVMQNKEPMTKFFMQQYKRGHLKCVLIRERKENA